MNTNNSSIRNNKNTEAVESICAELTAVCDAMYGRLKSSATRLRVSTGEITEEPRIDARGNTLFTVRDRDVEGLHSCFQQRTDWVALSKVLDHAKIPFTVNEGADGRDGIFGTVAGSPIGALIGDGPVFPDVHPTQQIVEAAREFMDDRWARQNDEHAAFCTAAHTEIVLDGGWVPGGFSGGSAGKDRLPIVS